MEETAENKIPESLVEAEVPPAAEDDVLRATTEDVNTKTEEEEKLDEITNASTKEPALEEEDPATDLATAEAEEDAKDGVETIEEAVEEHNELPEETAEPEEEAAEQKATHDDAEDVKQSATDPSEAADGNDQAETNKHPDAAETGALAVDDDAANLADESILSAPAEDAAQSAEVDDALSAVGDESVLSAAAEDTPPALGDASTLSAAAQDNAPAFDPDQGVDEHDVDTETAGPESRRDSMLSAAINDSQRRTSLRTEALIQAAARDIVAQLEVNRQRESLQSGTAAGNEGYISRSADGSVRHSDINDQAGDEGGDSSSHHENEDDVFSDHSPRSSMGSASMSEPDHKMDQHVTQRSRSPRISNISQYDQEEEFVPTVRGTPRPPFRSPSSVKAIQMSSPPPSVLGTPRSSRRTPLPTVSRLGSPSVSAQYSPKKTPPRFRRSTPPLVLLHVTLLPLRWPWADVLDQAQTDELSREGKSLRDAWRVLQDRMGDTVFERGILLPHPQNDYEILEERLLEALDLPMRRRARILECGHYLGPSNEMSLTEDSESDSEDEDSYYDGKPKRASFNRTHWCNTCHSDIRYDSLGPGKIFRVKVYASNGLMKAGAWEACWKEMERVDVELEPILQPGVQEELTQILAEQERALELREEQTDDEQEEEEEEEEEEELEQEDEPVESSFMEQEHTQPQILLSSPQHDTAYLSPPSMDERRRLEQERLKEIYGHTPPAHPEPASSPPMAPDFMRPATPPSPSAQAFERRQDRRHAIKSASLPELLLEAGRVLIQDKRNVMIGLLSLLVLMIAVRGGGQPEHDPRGFRNIVQSAEAATVTVTEAAPTMQTVETVVEPAISSISAATVTVTEIAPPVHSAEAVVEPVKSAEPVASVPVEPCSSEPSSSPTPRQEPETIVSERIVRIVETVTQTEVEVVKVTATHTQTEVETEIVRPTPSIEAKPDVLAEEAPAEPVVDVEEQEQPSQDTAARSVSPETVDEL
ncbi:hypothetical protein S40288_08863 [Stachybotrys chartarum IBT 40288]|nr:hypothetical protein S40288_08863 [Stachybotrys chartarum IBT 40288]